MTKFATIAALIVAIVMTTMGVAYADQPGERRDAANQPGEQTDAANQPGEKKDATAHPVRETESRVPGGVFKDHGLEEARRIDLPEGGQLLSGQDACTSTHTIDASDPALARQQLDDILLPMRSNNFMAAKYIICIEIINGPLLISSPLIISANATAADQILIELRGPPIDGLAIKAAPGFSADHLVKIQSGGPRIALVDWRIDGQGTDTCLEIDSADDAVVVSSTIMNCGVNVRIANSNNVRLGPETEEEFIRWKNTILDYSEAGIFLESGNDNIFAYNIINSSEIPDGDHYKHAIIIENRANVPSGKMQTVSPPFPVKQETADGKALVACTMAPDGVIRPRLKFKNAPGSIVFYRPTRNNLQEYSGTCNIGGDGICYIYHPDMVGTNCNCRNVQYVNALYTLKNTSEFMERVECPDWITPHDVEKPTALGEGATIPTPAPMADDPGVDVSDLTAGAAGGCGKSSSSLIPNDIALTHAPALGLWWIVFSVGVILGLRNRIKLSRAFQRLRGGKGQSRS